MQIKIFYFSIISFFLGIASFDIFNKSFLLFFYLFLIFIIFIAIFIYLKYIGTKYSKYSKYFLLFFLTFLFFLVGFGRNFIFYQNNVGEFEHLVGTQINLEMLVVAEAVRKGHRQKIIVKFPESNSRAAIWYRGVAEFFYGDKVQIKGYLLKPENFASETGRDFDYVSFLKKTRIFYTIKPISIKHISSQQGHFIKQKLLNLKSFFLGQIKKMIREPEASLLGGLILGAKEDMGKTLLEDFRKTGVIHIVVLSGYNLSLVAFFFMKIFAFLGLVTSSILGALSIVLFTVMTGASATIVRAAIMALLVILAKITGRTSEIIRALFVAAVIMLLFNPMLLLYSPSFQLSFLATLGLISLGPKIEEFIKFVPQTKLDFRGILAATLATQIFVLPLILYMMGSVSIVSPVVNLLILIIIPLTMFFGFLAVMFSIFTFSVASIFAFISFIFLAYTLKIVDIFADLPFAVFEYQFFTFWNLVSLYFIYFLIWIIYKKRGKSKI